MMRHRFLLLSTFLALACHTALSADISYGVTGSSGFGTASANSIYTFDTTTGVTSLVGSTSVTGNSFAYNGTNGYYYYGDHGGSNLYAFDVNLGTNTLLGDLTSVGMPTGTTLSGGADFYNGQYFYSPETTDANLYWVNFLPGGAAIDSGGSIAVTLPTGYTTLGDFGDIAVNPASGIMYGSSSNMGGAPDTAARLWTIDLNDPAYTMTILGTTPSVYQIAFDDGGTLVANEWTSGNIYHLNQATGAIEFTVGTDFGGDFFDLATRGAVPEPNSIWILAAGAVVALIRRRRAS